MYLKMGIALLGIGFAAPCNAQQVVDTLEGIGAAVMQNAPMPAPAQMLPPVATPVPLQAPSPVMAPNPVIVNQGGAYGSGDGQRPMVPSGPVVNLIEEQAAHTPAPYNPGVPVYNGPAVSSTFPNPNVAPPVIDPRVAPPPPVVNPWQHGTLGYGPPPAVGLPPTYYHRR